MSETVGKLEEEALQRKERLRQLARKQISKKGEQTLAVNDVPESFNIPRPIFRNYKPGSEEITETAFDDGRFGDVESEVSTQLEMMKTAIILEDIDIANLAPRKPDWDLKRDVSKKLEKLERRTQKAIAELIRERLREGQGQDILQAVNVASSSSAIAHMISSKKNE